MGSASQCTAGREQGQHTSHADRVAEFGSRRAETRQQLPLRHVQGVVKQEAASPRKSSSSPRKAGSPKAKSSSPRKAAAASGAGGAAKEHLEREAARKVRSYLPAVG